MPSNVTVVRGGVVWTGGADPQVIAGDLLIEDGVVSAIEPNYVGHADVELDASGCLVIPGLFNSHIHPGGSPVIRGLAEDVELPPNGAFYHNTAALLTLVRKEMTPREYTAIMEWDLLAMLRGGATTIIDEQISNNAIWLSLVEKYNFRCDLGLTYPERQFGMTHDEITADFQANLKLHDEYHGAFGDRLRIHLSPHGPDTVPDDILKETRVEADKRGITIHLHLAQHMGEVLAIKERSGGLSPVQYLDKMGFLGPDVLATHATYLEGDDLAVLAKSGTNIVHCGYRKSKEALTSPFVEFLEKDMNVTIGTDTFSHNLLEDLKFGAMLGKVRNQTISRPTADDLMYCATGAPAKALGRSDLGHLNPGARGDAVIVNFETPFNFPAFDVLKSLIYYSTASDVRHTIVDGKPVILDGVPQGVDMPALREEVGLACQRLWEMGNELGSFPDGAKYRPIHYGTKA